MAEDRPIPLENTSVDTEETLSQVVKTIPVNSAAVVTFVPSWSYAPAPDGLLVDASRALRTPHPTAVPDEIQKFIWYSCPNDQITTTATRTFTLFSNLPVELQRMIWKSTLPGPRYVEIRYDHHTNTFTSPTELPVSLSICHESRGVAREEYQLAFSTVSSPALIYFNFKIDQFYLGIGNLSPSAEDPEDYLFDVLNEKDISSIPGVAVDADVGWLFPNSNNKVFLDHLKGVKTFTIIQGFDLDLEFVLHKVQRGSAELQIWKVEHDGRIVPYVLPTAEDQNAGSWETCLATIWAAFETSIHHSKIGVSTIRVISRDRLARVNHLKKRMDNLETVVYSPYGCIYRKDGVIDKLIELEETNLDFYYELSVYLSQGKGDLYDPKLMYACQNACACTFQHKLAWWVEDVSFDDVDINGTVRGLYAE
jgi:hypothetical protein